MKKKEGRKEGSGREERKSYDVLLCLELAKEITGFNAFNLVIVFHLLPLKADY
jgi:hypothetical protein